MPKFAPIHPGEILQSEFLDELGITPYMLAKNTGIDKGNLSRIINGKSSISADTALRLARFFGTSPDSWMNLQTRYDLEVAKDRSQQRIEQEVVSYGTLV
ncbi:MAG: HigA family addiction module antitoxin [Proteobacteria bacterium]|nr:HigA family addiction module antitoxin [Pseudomonadota bacterium]